MDFLAVRRHKLFPEEARPRLVFASPDADCVLRLAADAKKRDRQHVKPIHRSFKKPFKLIVNRTWDIVDVGFRTTSLAKRLLNCCWDA